MFSFCKKNSVDSTAMFIVSAKRCYIESRPFSAKSQEGGREQNSSVKPYKGVFLII